MSYLFTLFFAILTDAKLGRAKTIILGFILYIIGFVLTTIFTYDTTQDAHACNTSNETNASISKIKKIYDQEPVGIDIALIIM